MMLEQRCRGPFGGHNLNAICHQLLFRYSTGGEVEIKCPRCKTVTVVRLNTVRQLV
jgi:hypothetical protein